MKALSIRQPWAWLIVTGEKPIENRSWASNYFGPLLIHAGLSFDQEGYRWVKRNFPRIRMPKPTDFARGAIVGKVDMMGCIEEGTELCSSPWFFGPYGFVLHNPKHFPEPIPYKGQLGIFNVDDTILAGGVMTERRGDWIQTFTGRQFWPIDPRPEDFDIEDIAHALSQTCRYNGHSREFYSVAQHSVLVAQECERRYPGIPDFAWWGLLHDIAEAYLPDIPRPVKTLDIGVLSLAEHLITKAAVVRFRLMPMTEPAEVKAIDSAILATEAAQLMHRPPNNCQWYLPEPPLDITIDPFLPRRAKKLFLLWWRHLEAKR